MRKAVGNHVVSCHRTIEVVIDLGCTVGQPGFQAEGLIWSSNGTIIKAIEPLNSFVPVDEAGRIDLFVEAASNPDVGSQWTCR